MKRITFDRRRIQMSLEGWYFTLVLMFIGTAAILRRANLLLILAAMLTAPILFNWRFVMASLRKLVVRRRIPPVAIAGRVFRIGMTVGNDSPMDSWQVQMDESITASDHKKRISVEVVVDRVPRHDRTTRSYECLLPHRGVYELGPTVVSTSYPLGLIRATAKIENGEPLLVGPKLGKLSKSWVELTNPDEVDEPHSVGQKGILDGMFYGIREFRQGDSRRTIHWRSTAKLGKPAVKQFEKQCDRELNLIVDLFDPGDQSLDENCESALSFAATLVDQICAAGKFHINLLVIGNRQYIHRGQAGHIFLEQAIRSLAKVEPDSKLDLTLCMDRYFVSKVPRGIVMIASSRAPTLTQSVASSNRMGLPTFAFHTQTGIEFPCLWLDTGDESFDKLFHFSNQQSGSDRPARNETKTQKSFAEPPKSQSKTDSSQPTGGKL